MPLVILCGFPCSGKSKRAEEIQKFFESTAVKSVLIQDDNTASHFLRNEVYADAQKEKELRSSLKSQVERHLSKDTVVILDSGNYIKGYRYELYCLSKSCKTTHCVIHCDFHPSDCWSLNESRMPPTQYDRSIFDALELSFEPPDSRNRWDSPLFTLHKDEDVPLKDIQEALFMRKAPPPNLSTQNVQSRRASKGDPVHLPPVWIRAQELRRDEVRPAGGQSLSRVRHLQDQEVL